MAPPVLLLLFAVLAAALMAYGTHPAWAQFGHGLEFIMAARRLQWPMVALSLGLCLALLGLVIAGRRRAWWLLGLAPVLALFVRGFVTDPAHRFACVDNPSFAAAADVRHVGDDDWVVALRFADEDYAYPYAALFDSPVVIHADHDKRVAVLWSAWANRAVALPVARNVRATDLEVVSTPGNGLLLYNGRVGQFVNGLTGRTPGGEKPSGFGEPLATVSKMTWRAWRQRHADGRVMLPIGRGYEKAPRVPIRPAYPLPQGHASGPGHGHVLVGISRPLAIPSAKVTAAPLNVMADGVPAVVFRDPEDGTLRAFERRLGDLRPRFRPATGRRRDKAMFIDEESDIGWNAQGIAVDGPAAFHGKRLPRMAVDDQLHYGVMLYAYRDNISYFQSEDSATTAGETTRPAD